jgi:hypothetical protein
MALMNEYTEMPSRSVRDRVLPSSSYRQNLYLLNLRSRQKASWLSEATSEHSSESEPNTPSLVTVLFSISLHISMVFTVTVTILAF